MQTTYRHVGVVAIFSLLVCGCGGSEFAFVDVTGRVTYDGAPVSGLRVTFSPLSVGDDHVRGPYSAGVTDSDGKYSLTSRYDDPGAVAGKHEVNFEYADTLGGGGIGELQEELASARESGAKEDIVEVQKRIEAFKSRQNSRPKISRNMLLEIDIPSGGTTSADFELAKQDEAGGEPE
jgi:hypothetical protein